LYIFVEVLTIKMVYCDDDSIVHIIAVNIEYLEFIFYKLMKICSNNRRCRNANNSVIGPIF